jgi:hypothetical protein
VSPHPGLKGREKQFHVALFPRAPAAEPACAPGLLSGALKGSSSAVGHKELSAIHGSRLVSRVQTPLSDATALIRTVLSAKLRRVTGKMQQF